MASAEQLKARMAFCSPGSAIRIAAERLDGHFGTNTVLVEDSLLLPTEIQKEMSRTGYRSGAKGVFDIESNTVYLIASNLENTKDAVMAYRHEVTGHYGVRESLGSERDDVFRAIYDSYATDPRLEEIAQRYRLDLSYADNQLLAAEELVAHMAESGDKPTAYDQIRLKAKEDFSQTTGAGIEYTDDDIRVLLQRGRDHLITKTQHAPSDRLSLRSPAELNPRWAKLNHLLNRQPEAITTAFDQWLMTESQYDLGVASQSYDNQYLMLERYAQFLRSVGLDVLDSGDVRVDRVTEQGGEIVGADPVVVPDGPGTVFLRTEFTNLNNSAGGQASVIDPLLAQITNETASSQLRFMYVGESGADRIGRLDSFARATQMKMENRTSGEIWMATGWFEGPDGAWRVEISDRDVLTIADAAEQRAYSESELSTLNRQHLDGVISEAELARRTRYHVQALERVDSAFEDARPGTLPAFLSHPTLYEAYPELKDMRVIIDPDAPYPEVTTNTPRIIIPTEYREDPDRFRQALLHETQHLVQRIEGFSRGLSPFMNGHREQWESELNELLETDPDVLIYLDLQTELIDGSLRVNRDQTREDIEALEEASPSVQRLNELTERLKLAADPEAYTKAFGEIEAGDTANRAAMTEGQRRNISPYSSTLPPDREVIVHHFDDIAEAMFLGVAAKHAKSGKLSQAHDMEMAGATPEDILAETGWFRGVDTMWRFEIDDSQTGINQDALSILTPAWETLVTPRISSITHRKNPESGFDVRLVPEAATKVSEIIDLKGVSRSFLMMSLPRDVAVSIMQSKGELDYYDLETDEPNGFRLKTDFVYDVSNALPLDRLVHHPTLFENYPQLSDWSVAFHPATDDYPDSSALCDVLKKHIVLFPRARHQMIPAILHEIQHAVQNIEGFAMGASPNDPEVNSRVTSRHYHSAVLRAIELAPFDRGSPEQWSAFLKNQPGVKKTELEWLGLDDHLGGKVETVSSVELARYVSSQQLVIEESLSDSSHKHSAEYMRNEIEKWMQGFADLAAERGANRESVYQTLNEARATIGWQLYNNRKPPAVSDFGSLAQLEPGGDSRFTLKNFEAQIQAINKVEALADNNPNPTDYDKYSIAGGEDYRELLIIASEASMADSPVAEFMSSHWGEHRNVLAHARFQTFRQNDGSKVLLIEEIQSDWRNDDAAKSGFAEHAFQELQSIEEQLSLLANDLSSSESRLAEVQEKLKAIGSDTDVCAVHDGLMDTSDAGPDTQSKLDEYNRLVAEAFELVSNIEDCHGQMALLESRREKSVTSSREAPKSFPLGNDWFAMVGKRMIRYAAENGFDAVAWSPASIQAERNKAGTRQRLDWLEWSRDETGKVTLVGDVDGEEVIRESVIEEDLPRFLSSEVAREVMGKAEGILQGPDLTFDARGFEQFYNQMLPKAMNKYLKTWGEAVQHSSLDTMQGVAKDTQFPTIRITKAMKNDLAGTTTPMYRAEKRSAMDTYWRSAGEVEARAVEATYRNPQLRLTHPIQRYDVPVHEQIVGKAEQQALKIGPGALGADVSSMRRASEIAAEMVLGVPEAAEPVFQALSGRDRSGFAEEVRQNFAKHAHSINHQLRDKCGWTLDDTGYLRFDLKAPDCRAHRSISEVIADDVRKFAEDVRADRVPVSEITATYNQITQQCVPLSRLIGDHSVLSAYPVLDRVVVQQSNTKPSLRWDAESGKIVVPKGLSRAELGGYLTLALNQAVNSLERLADMQLQKVAGVAPDRAEIDRAAGIARFVEQCRSMNTRPCDLSLTDSPWLAAEDSEVLSKMTTLEAQSFHQMSQLNIKGSWNEHLSIDSTTKPDAANDSLAKRDMDSGYVETEKTYGPSM